MMDQYWGDYPDLYQTIQNKKKNNTEEKREAVIDNKEKMEPPISTEPTALKKLFNPPLRGAALRQKCYDNHCQIRQRVLATGSEITPRTQAHNRKCDHKTIEEARDFRGEVVQAQLRAWRCILPLLLRRFSKLPDYRQVSKIKHKMTVLMMFGLLAFIFRFSSRREMNRELTGPVIVEHLQKLFPEIESVPHADTLARILVHTNPHDIEAIHISLMQDLIKKKKFKKVLINGCLPISIDGTQKLTRDGLLQDERWCERRVGDGDDKQQYLYILEANITLQNGLTITLMSEYLYRESNQLEQPEGKQDNELTAAERLIKRLKKYFPRLKIMIIGDAMFADTALMEKMSQYHWEYIVSLPKKKLKDCRKQLNSEKSNRVELEEASYYRERKQSFCWKNNITGGYNYDLSLNVVGCLEEYEEVNKKTGEIETCFSEHAWISSIAIDKNNVHLLTNLAGRKNFLLENNINQAKNDGYQYKHLFSYNWHAMQGFHYLMRLGQAINLLCEWTKVLRKTIREIGWSATLKLIKETLFSPWLSSQWYDNQLKKTAQLRLQFE